jgi:hypothetical protein
MELGKRWGRVTFSKNKGEWWLSAPGHSYPNRAYITWPATDETRVLMLWSDAKHDWVAYMRSDDLKALKAIGRIQAALNLTQPENTP